MENAKDLREKSTEDLLELEARLLRDTFNLKNESRISKKLKKPHLVREKRRDRARVLTVLSERQ